VQRSLGALSRAHSDTRAYTRPPLAGIQHARTHHIPHIAHDSHHTSLALSRGLPAMRHPLHRKRAHRSGPPRTPLERGPRRASRHVTCTRRSSPRFLARSRYCSAQRQKSSRAQKRARAVLHDARGRPNKAPRPTSAAIGSPRWACPPPTHWPAVRTCTTRCPLYSSAPSSGSVNFASSMAFSSAFSSASPTSSNSSVSADSERMAGGATGVNALPIASCPEPM